MYACIVFYCMFMCVDYVLLLIIMLVIDTIMNLF